MCSHSVCWDAWVSFLPNDWAFTTLHECSSTQWVTQTSERLDIADCVIQEYSMNMYSVDYQDKIWKFMFQINSCYFFQSRSSHQEMSVSCTVARRPLLISDGGKGLRKRRERDPGTALWVGFCFLHLSLLVEQHRLIDCALFGKTCWLSCSVWVWGLGMCASPLFLPALCLCPQPRPHEEATQSLWRRCVLPSAPHLSSLHPSTDSVPNQYLWNKCQFDKCCPLGFLRIRT